MYPIMLNLKGKQAVIVGGGQVAARKIRSLLEEGASVQVISPSLDPQIPQEQIDWVARPYQTGDLAKAHLVFACTDQVSVNHQVRQDAPLGVMVNNSGDKSDSDFYNVAQIRATGLTITVSTEGHSPAQAKQMREAIARYLKMREGDLDVCTLSGATSPRD